MTEDGAAVLAKALTEKQLSDQIVNLARAVGWLVHRDPTWRATGTDPGYPDLTLVKNRQIIFMELKAEKGRLTQAQEIWRQHLMDQRMPSTFDVVRYFIVRPSDWYAGRVEEVLR